MPEVYKTLKKDCNNVLSIRLFIILTVLGLFNFRSSIIYADELRAFPGAVVFNSVAGHSLSDTRSVFIFSAGGASMNWSDSKSASWITVDRSGGNTEAVLKIGVNTNGLQTGLHYGSVTIQSSASSGDPIVVSVTLIINPDVPVMATKWKDGYPAAMSVSVDSRPSGFDDLQANGYSGTYFYRGTYPESYLTDYYNAGMEIGSHTVNHTCTDITDDDLRHVELETNILAICSYTPQPCKDVISFDWPCGYTTYRMQAIASEYFLSSRGYNINQLEDATPENFMNLKCYNSHEHIPYPPEDLRTVIDQAISEEKWFNLVLHEMNASFTTDVNYAHNQNIWVESIGSVIKYLMQRDRFILTDYNQTSDRITCNVSRLQIPSSIYRNFETAFGSADMTTLQIDIDDARTIDHVLLNGSSSAYQIKNDNGNKVLLLNVRLDPSNSKSVEVDYLTQGLTLSVTGVTAGNKVYDRSTSAVLNTGSAALAGLLAGDNVTLNSSGASGSFINKNAGTGKPVTTTGFSLSGPDAGKYTLIQPSPLATISKVTITVSGVTANNKVYNRTTTTTLNTGGASLSGVLSGDAVTLVSSGASGNFANKSVGNGKTVAITGLILGGTDGANYSLIQPSSAANITRAELTVSGVTADDKTYDGTTDATLNTGAAILTGLFTGDNVTLSKTAAFGSFEDESVGSDKIVNTSGFTIGGTDSGNYTLTQPVTTANITGIILTVTGVTANNKVYNRSTSAIINTSAAALVGVQSGDIVNLVKSGASGTFTDKNTGTGKTVSTTGFSLSGADAANYSLIQPTANADITRAIISVTGVTVNNRSYNGTANATLNTASAVFSGDYSGDVVTLVASGATATFVNKNAGTGKIVTITGLTTGGADGTNYTLTQPSATANITPATLTVSGISAANKIYDATTSVTLGISGAVLSGVFVTDLVTLNSSSVTAVFTSKSTGNNKQVTVSGFTIGGTDSGNYTLTQPSITANISAAALTITGVTANSKIYNASAAASLNTTGAVLSGVYGGDAVNLITAGATATFADKNAGTGKVVSSAGFMLGGSDASNYSVIQPVSLADISRATLTVTGITVPGKIYNGTTTATLNSVGAVFSGVFPGDIVTLVSTGATGTFVNKNAGTGKAVAISGLTTGGTDGSNYTLTQPTATANITPATLTATGITSLNKVYDATTTATLNTGSASLAGIFGTDQVTLNTGSVTGIFNNKNTGISKAVTISGLTIGGNDAGNYTLTQPVINSNITPLALTVTGVTAASKVYNGTASVSLNNSNAALSGVIPGDIVTLITTGASGSFANKNAGTGKTVSSSGYSTGGTDSGNYTIIQPSLTADITKASVSITGVSANNKVYDGTTTATLNTGSAMLTGVVGGDLVSLQSASATGIFANKNAGNVKPVTTSRFLIVGSDADNYLLTQPVLTANISQKPLTIIANSLIKHFRTTLTFTGNEFTAIGLVQGDVISGLVFSSTGSIVSAVMGTYPILVSGGSDPDYNFSYISGDLTVGKSKLFATADPKSKIYGSANPAFTISYSGFFSGDEASMLDVQPVAAATAVSTSDAGVYAITLSGGSDHNYDFVLTNGVLTVEKATLTASADDKTRAYKETNPDLTISYTGFVNGQDKSILDILPSASTDADINSDAGTYDINVSGASDGNYSIVYNKGTLSIVKADQLITFDTIPLRLRMTQESRLTATSTSGLPVIFETSDPTIGVVEGDMLKVKKEGHLTISAIQKGDHNWNAAQDVSQIIETLPTFDGISSLFTPNNDGMNDYWYIPELEQYGKLQVTVYNRFGQAVYRSDSYRNDWDGTWNGSPLPSASYYYIIKSSARGFIKGVVNIVR